MKQSVMFCLQGVCHLRQTSTWPCGPLTVGGGCCSRAALPLHLSAVPKPGLSHPRKPQRSRPPLGAWRPSEAGAAAVRRWCDQPGDRVLAPFPAASCRDRSSPQDRWGTETEVWDVLGNPIRKGKSTGEIRPVHLQAVNGSAGSSRTPKERESNWCPLSVSPKTAQDSVTGGNRFPRELNQPFWWILGRICS